MSNFPARGTVVQKKSRNFDDFDDNNHLDEALKLLDQLFDARLIDHIARPIDRKIKESHIEQYRLKLNSLHARLKKILDDSKDRNHSERNTKGKSNVGSTTCKPRQWHKYVRNIENRYNDVVVDGSFKFFKKVCDMLGLRYDYNAMEPINIEQWAQSCLNNKEEDSCC